jgi:hypothetical protein
MANDPTRRPTARALEDMLATLDLDGPQETQRESGPGPGDDGPPTVRVQQRGPIASFIQHLFGR